MLVLLVKTAGITNLSLNCTFTTPMLDMNFMDAVMKLIFLLLESFELEFVPFDKF